MAAGDTTQGRRLPDARAGQILPDGDFPEEGDYWLIRYHPDWKPGPENLTGNILGICTPGCGGGIAVLSLHTVRENLTGTITVAPNDGSSNSIKVDSGAAGNWHGYIENGVWREV